jgi:hypothetical protein
LQDFKFEKTYDVIWVQWVLCYLPEWWPIEVSCWTVKKT